MHMAGDVIQSKFLTVTLSISLCDAKICAYCFKVVSFPFFKLKMKFGLILIHPCSKGKSFYLQKSEKIHTSELQKLATAGSDVQVAKSSI